jgi:sugar phosphate isomerase/epimerase
MKLALREDMAPGDSLPERLAWLERVGLEGIELHGRSLDLPPDQLKAIVATSSVGVANVAGSPNLLHPDPRERTAAKELTQARLRLAGELGAAGVLVVPQFGRGPALPDLSPLTTAVELERELLVLQLGELAPTAREAGVPLFLEPLNRYEAHLVNRVDQGAAFAERVGPEVATMADFFHMNIEEPDIAASIRAAGRHLVYVHVADSNRLQPGRGHLDFRPGFAALKEIGYDGYLGIECRIDGPYDDAIRECALLLRELWAAA